MSAADPEPPAPALVPDPEPPAPAPVPDPELPAPAPDPSSTPLWRRVGRDIAVGAVGAAIAGIGAAAGVAHISWVWLLLMGTVLAGIGICVERAMTASQPEVRALWWCLGLAAALMLSAGSFAYHIWFDPAERPHRTYQFVVNGDEVNVISLYGEAGGKPQMLATGEAGQNGLIGGEAYEFDCWAAVGKESQVWLKYHRFGRIWWAPRALLHAPAGVHQPRIPHC